MDSRCLHSTYVYQDILQYLQPSKKEGLGSFFVPNTLDREERGLENHATARFLMPRQHLDKFERSPDRQVMPYPSSFDPSGLPLT